MPPLLLFSLDSGICIGGNTDLGERGVQVALSLMALPMLHVMMHVDRHELQMTYFPPISRLFFAHVYVLLIDSFCFGLIAIP